MKDSQGKSFRAIPFPSLAEGATTPEILADFPTLSEDDVRAAIAFAAGSAQEAMPLIATPIKR